MNTLKLYKNRKPYPYYGATALTWYKDFIVTPLHQNLKGGFVDLQLTQAEILNFNYLSYTRNGREIFAWVEDVEKLKTSLNYRVHFTIDALRTYKNNLVYGTQFIARSPVVTTKEDPYLSSAADHDAITTHMASFSPDPSTRYAVVQLRRPVGGVYSRVPGPSPYQFWICPYSVNNWSATGAITRLFSALSTSGETSNVVTIYSVPYITPAYYNVGSNMDVIVGGNTTAITGWGLIGETVTPLGNLVTKKPLSFDAEGLTLTPHTISIIIPEAGIMNIPDEIAFADQLSLVRSIDIFSGACNYHLEIEGEPRMTPVSVRGASLSTIPILSNPYDTYISQNQNALAVSLIGDVANMAIGAGALMSGVGGPLGAGMVSAGAAGILNTVTTQADKKNMIPSNPPAFLGSALLSEHNDYYYEYITRKPQTNAVEVHARYGYPVNKLGALTVPAVGYIQTSACSLSSDGSVPLWAIHEINALFDGGLLFS